MVGPLEGSMDGASEGAMLRVGILEEGDVDGSKLMDG